MQSPFPSYAAAVLGLLALASGCVTTTESKRPATASMRPTASMPITANTSPVSEANVDPSLDALATEAPDGALDPNSLSAKATAAARAAERALSPAEYRYQLARANLVLKTNPKNARALFERAKANSTLKNYKAAKPDYVAALRALRGNPDLHYNKAVNEMMLSEYRLAAIDFSNTVKLRPNDKEAYFGRGVAKMQMYQYPAAVADFTRALALDSLYADAFEYRGISYASYDRNKEARRDLEKAAKLNPEAQKSLRHYTTSLVQK